MTNSRGDALRHWDGLPEIAPTEGANHLQPASAAGARAWFCLRAQPKHEHIAAAHLVQFDDVAVFNPRIRFPRSTRRGPVWVTEALFPGYLFAEFDWRSSLSKVRYAQGVSGVVHFGTRWPTVPPEVVADLKRSLGDCETHEVPVALTPGDAVNISGGVFHGLQAVITQVMPAKQRVAVLLEFLGTQTALELDADAVVKTDFHPLSNPGGKGSG